TRRRSAILMATVVADRRYGRRHRRHPGHQFPHRIPKQC
ncbi:MAG: hypothetical protein ACI90V_009733, partial [Bacillariaceae sp.]